MGRVRRFEQVNNFWTSSEIIQNVNGGFKACSKKRHLSGKWDFENLVAFVRMTKSDKNFKTPDGQMDAIGAAIIKPVGHS